MATWTLMLMACVKILGKQFGIEFGMLFGFLLSLAYCLRCLVR